MPIKPSRATDEYYALVNELLPKASAMGAYAIGVVTALAWQHGLDPERNVLELAAECTGVEEAVAFFEDWQRYQVRA